MIDDLCNESEVKLSWPRKFRVEATMRELRDRRVVQPMSEVLGKRTTHFSEADTIEIRRFQRHHPPHTTTPGQSTCVRILWQRQYTDWQLC